MKRSNRAGTRIMAVLFGALLGGLPSYAATADGGYPGYRAVAGDFNGDGFTDLLFQPLPGYHGTAEFLAYPDGNFGGPTATWPDKSLGTDWNAGAHRIVVGDFNGDDRDDLVLQGAAGLASQEYLAAPDGSFSSLTRTLPATLGGQDLSQASHALVVGDFNGDGRDDLLLQADNFVGTDGVAIAGAGGGFPLLSSQWGDGTLGLSWSADRAAAGAGDFNGDQHAELLLRDADASGNGVCCRTVAFGADENPKRIVQSWDADYLGVDWDPATHQAVIGDLDGDGRDDLLVQPDAPEGDLYVLLADPDGKFTAIADQWPSERDGVDWSAESYLLVPEKAKAGKGATLAMIPRQLGLPYMRARFDASGHLVGTTMLAGPPSDALAVLNGATHSPSGGGGGNVAPARHPARPHVQPQVVQGNTVGAMAGDAGVANGTATYSIPIAVPPGRAGMAPSLSLGYSSSGGDGHEGVGWSLGGLSAIYRCPATAASDGYARGTQFDSGDHFCLDGQKLMLTSGTYGRDGSIYHAEVNGFAKVVADGQTQGTSGPESFTVTTPDGKTLTYGGSDDSRLTNSGGSVFTWALTKSVDADGNEVDYHYHNANGEYYPDEIDYTLHDGALVGAQRKVVFDWDPRSSVGGAANLVHYLAGMKLQTTQVLMGIDTYVGGAHVRSYKLSYQQSAATNRPLLDSVQACAYAGDGSEHCFNPATFSYQGEHAPQFVSVDPDNLGLSALEGGCSMNAASPYGDGYDQDGDGLGDVVSFKQLFHQIDFSIQYGKPTGFEAPQPMTANLAVGVPIDFNVDGRTDSFKETEQGGDSPNWNITILYQNGNRHWTPQPTDVTWPVGQSRKLSNLNNNGLETALVADVNGDGKPDFVTYWSTKNPAQDHIKIWLASGTGNATTYTAGATFTTSQWIYAAQALDYDADGRSDLLIRYKSGPDSDHYILLHSERDNGTDQLQPIETNIPVDGSGDDIPPIVPTDVNGDSLPDILAAAHSGGNWRWVVYPNAGDPNGQFGSAEETGIDIAKVDGYPLDNFVHTIREPDGRADLLVPTARTWFSLSLQAQQCNPYDPDCGGSYWVDAWPCSGYNTRTDQTPISRDGYDWELYRADGAAFGLTDSGLGFDNLGTGSPIDFNHDGIPDVVGAKLWIDNQDLPHFHRVPEAYKFDFSGGTPGADPTPMPDLMVGADNGFGVSTSFDYQPLANPSTSGLYQRGETGETSYPEMQFSSPMQVVASMSQTNADESTNTYDYRYADARYNVAGRGFLGFAKITVTDERRGTETETDYRQDFPYIGSVAQSQTSANGTAYLTATTDWDSNRSGSAGDYRYVVYAAHSTSHETDPESAQTLISDVVSTQSNVDACGNPIGTPSETQTTTTQQATAEADTTLTYNGGDPDDCWHDTVDKQIVTSTVNYTEPPVTNDTLTTTTKYTYFPGDEKVKTRHVTAPHGGQNQPRDWSYGYDAFGNPASVTQTAADMDDRTTTSDYDDDGYFPVKVTNAMGQIAQFTYDPATGNKTSALDPNLIETDYAFDAFGRSAGGAAPGASAVAITYLDPGGGYACPNYAAYVVEQSQAGYPESYGCYDALGDELRAAKQGFDGSWIYVDTSYDELGRALTKTVPHFSGDYGYPTLFEDYDVLDRPGEVEYPNGRDTNMTYDGLEISYADTASGQTHHYRHSYDGLGKGNGNLVEVDQENNGDWIAASYRYDAGGNLIQATDAMGNAILASYDGFGDKLSLADPDKGSWSYVPDGFGEQTSVTDARGKTITTDYDLLGRKTAEHDPADAGGRLASWTYDTADHGIGAVASETVEEGVNAGGDPSETVYARTYGYDTAGRATASEITVDGTSYLQGTGYDDDGRPETTAYPALGGSEDQAPVSVNATSDPPGPVATGSAVSLLASGNDPDGWGLSYHWQQTAGPTASLSGEYGEEAQALLPAAGNYSFKVTASDDFHQTTDTVNIEAKDLPATGPVPTLSPAVSHDGSFEADWDALAGAASYTLQEQGGPGDPRSWTVTGTQKNVTGRAVGSYTFRVKGCNEVGCGAYGAASAEVSVEAPPPPSAPVVGPNPSPDGSYTVSWGSVDGADWYDLDEQHGGSWTEHDNLNTRSWNTSQSANGTWNYKARACNGVTGCGAWSALASETVDFVPATPTGFQRTPILVHTNQSYTLVWDGMAHAASYDLAYDGTGATQTGIMDTDQQETAPGQAGMDIFWRVRACNGNAECSDWSDPAMDIYVSCQPGAPGCDMDAPSGGGGEGGGRRAPGPHGLTPHTLADGGTGTLVVTTAYNATGYATTLTRASDGLVYGTVEKMDAWGHATMIEEANGVTLTRGYSQATGLAINLLATSANAPPGQSTLAQYTYQWDGYGNLAERDDVLAGSEESESYDDLNRLTKSILTLAGGGGGTTTYHYDASGNRIEVCSDGDCVTYSYGAGAAGPHAVTANSDGGSYAYDANGEMTSDNDRTLTWAAFGQPTAITQSGTDVSLAYDAENARYEKSVATDSGTETVLYLGAAEKLTVNGQTSIRRTLALADLTILDTGGAHAGLLFPIADHLGSSILLGGGDGSTAQAMSYGPFGERMSAGWAGAVSVSQALTINQTETDRGYTGQEGLDAVALWDYNARLYDPALGRFLSVDPLIAHPESTQGINPYSYVENNPLNKTDPTGTMSACMAQGVCDSVKIQGMGSIGKGGPAQQQEQQEQQNSDSTQKSSDDSTTTDTGPPQGPKAANSTGKTNVNDPTTLDGKSDAKDGDSDSSADRAFTAANYRDVQGSVQGKETQLYYDSNGKVVWKTQTGCHGDDICTVYKVSRATVMAHTHVYHDGESPQRGTLGQKAAALSRNMPGYGDAAPLQIYSESLVKGPGGETFSLRGARQNPTVRYSGGGDAAWGEYVQKHWKPNKDDNFYQNMAKDWLRVNHVYRGAQ